jgi:hypothetical protein
MNNYELSRNRAQQYFLGFDQERMLKSWCLQHDEAFIYLDFLGQSYRICRSTGVVYRQKDGVQADFNVVLSIFDLLCHESDQKLVTGRFAPVNSLKGNAAVGVGTDFHSPIAARIDDNPEAFCCACENMGGTPVNMGDLGYRFPVFADLNVILKFYHSDEDFPASITLLWEENMLQFVYYETVFYIAGALLRQLEAAMQA